MKADDGKEIAKNRLKWFKKTSWDPKTRNFTGFIDWTDQPVMGGEVSWEMKIFFSEDFSQITERTRFIGYDKLGDINSVHKPV